MSKRRVSQSIDPYSRTEEVLFFRRVKHRIKDIIDDIIDERVAAKEFNDVFFIDWKKVNSDLDQNLQIMRTHTQRNIKAKEKTRAKAPKDLSFYVYPGEHSPVVSMVRISVGTGAVFSLVGTATGALIRHVVGQPDVDVTAGTSKGITYSVVLGLTIGMGVGLCIGLSAASLYIYLRRIRISILDIFARCSDFVSDDKHVHATVDVSEVGVSDLSSDE